MMVRENSFKQQFLNRKAVKGVNGFYIVGANALKAVKEAEREVQMGLQLQLFVVDDVQPEKAESASSVVPIELLDLNEYTHFIVSYSGGKDSLALLLYLLEMGVPREKIILAHQNVDGMPGENILFDWPVTESYVLATGEALGIKVEFQWRTGGLYAELLKQNDISKGIQFTWEGELFSLPPGLGAKLNTRRRWPAKSPDLKKRWCSSNVKIEVFSRMVNNLPEFQVGTADNPIRVLVLTGERWEESSNRATYYESILHRCNAPTKHRYVHHWRGVVSWSEKQIWDLIAKWRITPHPAYLLGWGRTSCFGCVFSQPDHWAMMREIAPDRFRKFVKIEREIGHTIENGVSLDVFADRGSLRRLPKGAEVSRYVELALGHDFTTADFFIPDGTSWELPAGAFKGDGGPN